MAKSYFLVCMILATTQNAHASRCSGNNETTYLRSESTRLMEFAMKTVKDVTLNACVTTCTESLLTTEDCLSFEYDAQKLECSLHSDDGQPFGPSVLTPTNSTMAFFQQICIEKDVLCDTPYSFERYPQSILVGHATKVTIVNGLSECLATCLNTLKLKGFLCRSVMYYYETGECIVNRDTKALYPHLFKTSVQETLVDYFENNCADVSCKTTETLHWIRTEEYLIDELKDVIVESSDPQHCNSICIENRIGDERFPCKAFVYSTSKQECHLTAESSYAGHKADRNFKLAPISNGEYFEKYCLNTNLQCLDASFELVPNRMMTNNYKIMRSLSPHECLAECMKEGARCSSVTYFYQTDQCQLSDISQFSRPDSFVVANFTDYFDKICEPTDPKMLITTTTANSIDQPVQLLSTEKTEKIQAKGTANFALAEKESANSVDDDLDAKIQIDSETSQTTSQVEETVVDDSDDFNKESSEEKVKGRLSTECRMSGITIAIEFAHASTGAIYIKDHFSTCRKDYSNATFAELHMPFPTNDDPHPKCGGVEYEPGKWKFPLVVQKDEMKAPSLITSKDKTFDINCDFSQIVDKEHLQSLARRAPDPEFKSEKISMEIQKDGVAVTTVPLGAEVELKWTVNHPEGNLGFFINECVAERVGGVAPEPEPLKIIYQGCPEEKVRNKLLSDPVIKTQDGYSTKMKVFRFDGSRRVRIKCSIDVCVHDCPPVICDDLHATKNVDSYGKRKKRSALLDQLLAESRQRMGKGKRSVVAGTLTITDEQEKKVRPRPEFSTASKDDFCIRKGHIELCIMGVLLFVILQVAICSFCYRKKRDMERSCSSMDTSSMNSDTSILRDFNYPSSNRSSIQPPPSIPPPVAPRRTDGSEYPHGSYVNMTIRS